MRDVRLLSPVEQTRISDGRRERPGSWGSGGEHIGGGDGKTDDTQTGGKRSRRRKDEACKADCRTRRQVFEERLEYGIT